MCTAVVRRHPPTATLGSVVAFGGASMPPRHRRLEHINIVRTRNLRRRLCRRRQWATTVPKDPCSASHATTATTPLTTIVRPTIATWLESQRCELSSIQVQQTNTGKKVGFDPVFEVEVRNQCRCTVRSVFLQSEGFASSMMVDPKLFRREGASYLVNDGKGIPSSDSVKFCYAWDRAFTMSPASFQLGCW
ncbi:hypothetical protein GW17_00049930 [Ensete ventricosum]|nr:hypothetical protein GW17_00049930 [Ensete ventricosum]